MRLPVWTAEGPRAVVIDARLPSRPAWRAWAGALAAVALLAILAWGFQTQVERWMLRATFRAARDEEPKRIDDRFVGRWISSQGGRVLVSRAGVVWFEAGDLVGTGAFDAALPSRFVFDGPGFRCTYDLTIGRDVSDWRLLDHSAHTTCPEGHFVRSFTD